MTKAAARAPIIPALHNVPDVLRNVAHWVCWRYEVVDGRETKVPYRCQFKPRKAATDDPSSWSDFDTAMEYAGFHSGIGFVVTPDLGIVGVDIDGCAEDGQPNEFAQHIICTLDTFTERSPSGNGFRLWLRGTLPPGGRRRGTFEIYNSGRYLTVTGNHLPHTPMTVEPRQTQVEALLAEIFPPKPQLKARAPRVVSDLEWSDQELLDKAFSAGNGGKIKALWEGDVSGYESDDSRADAALCAFLAFYCGVGGEGRLDYLFRQSALMRPKWDRRHRSDGATYGQITIEKAYAGCSEFYEASDYVDLEPLRRSVTDTSRSVTKSQQVDKPANVSSKHVDTSVEKEKCHRVTAVAEDAQVWGAITTIKPDLMVPFPAEALPRVLGSYVQNVADVVQVPVDLPALAALSVLSFAVSRRWNVQIRPSYIEPTNLYTAAAMEPGSRKSSALEQIVFPLRKYEEDMVNANREDRAQRKIMRKAAEDRIAKRRRDLANENDPVKRDEIAKEIADLDADMVEAEPDPRLLVEDVTPEKLVGLLSEQKGTLALVSSEGGVFGTMGGRYNDGQSNLDVYLKGHDGESYRVDRLNRTAEFLPATRLAICLTVQPDVLQSLSTKREFRGRGLLGRFLYAVPADLRGCRFMDLEAPGLDPELRHEYGQAIIGLLMSPPVDVGKPYERHIVRLSREALRVHVEYANRVEREQGVDGDMRPFSDWASKLAGRVARIAATFHCLEHRAGTPHTVPLSDETILQAWAIAEYLTAHAVRAFDMMTETDNARNAMRILDWIRRNRHETFTARECQRRNQRHLNAKTADQALSLLALNNYVRQMADKNGSGREVRWWDVNPAFLAGSPASE